jgi:hypothetical protein
LQRVSDEVAEAAAAEWWSHKDAGPDSIPIGVIAALALNGRARDTGPSPAQVIRDATDDEIADLLAGIWAMFWIIRCRPFGGWLEDQPRSAKTVAAAAAVARAATRAGLFTITRQWEMLCATDLLGPAYLHLRVEAAKRVNGEYYTPPDMCRILALLTFFGDETKILRPGMAINDPTGGTGGCLRAVAEILREHGLDPHDFWWVTNDIDPIVTAGLAVNAHLWNLGPRVVIGTADILIDPEWHQRAWKEQLAAIAKRDACRGRAEAGAAFRAGIALADQLMAPPEPEAAPAEAPASPDEPEPGTLF